MLEEEEGPNAASVSMQRSPSKTTRL